MQHAIQVGKRLRAAGHELVGVRLDSGDLGALSHQTRKLLDQADFHQAAIVASNDLDEYAIADWKVRRAPIGIWGVGTRLVTAYDQPSLGGVYKLSALRTSRDQWEHKLKCTENDEKSSLPGMLQVRRFHRNSAPQLDMLYDELTPTSNTAVAINENQETLVMDNSLETEDLLTPVMRAGTVVSQSPSLQQLQQRTRDQLAQFGIESWQQRDRSATYRVAPERHFFDRTQTLLRAVKETTS